MISSLGLLVSLWPCCLACRFKELLVKLHAELQLARLSLAALALALLLFGDILNAICINNSSVKKEEEEWEPRTYSA